MRSDKKELILKFLEKEGRQSTSRIAIAVKGDFWTIEKYLKELNEENKVISDPESKATYWLLK